MILAADSGHFMSALCLLDLTAAFDTVDHDLLTLRLERQFGLRGIVAYSSSFDRICLTDLIKSSTATIRHQKFCSVPQGSVLGPRLFISYTADLANVVV